MEDKWVEQLKELKCLPEEDLKQLCEKAKENAHKLIRILKKLL